MYWLNGLEKGACPFFLDPPLTFPSSHLLHDAMLHAPCARRLILSGIEGPQLSFEIRGLTPTPYIPAVIASPAQRDAAISAATPVVKFEFPQFAIRNLRVSPRTWMAY